jgi:hypothetical protein
MGRASTRRTDAEIAAGSVGVEAEQVGHDLRVRRLIRDLDVGIDDGALALTRMPVSVWFSIMMRNTWSSLPKLPGNSNSLA